MSYRSPRTHNQYPPFTRHDFSSSTSRDLETGPIHSQQRIEAIVECEEAEAEAEDQSKIHDRVAPGEGEEATRSPNTTRTLDKRRALRRMYSQEEINRARQEDRVSILPISK